MKDNKHAQWKKNIYKWIMIRDAIDGESCIKLYSELYLPMPAAMLLSTSESPSAANRSSNITMESKDIHNTLVGALNPNDHSNPSYAAYKARAKFPEFPGHIHRGLVGIAIAKAPTFNLPSQLSYLEEKFTKSGTSLIEFYQYVLNEVLATGRLGILMDVNEEVGDEKPYAVSYVAEAVYDWEQKKNTGENVEFKKVVLAQDVEGQEEKEGTIELTLDGFYESRRFADGDPVEEAQPVAYMGNGLTDIPFVAVGSTDISPDVDIAPMAGICRNAVQIYQMDADLRQAEYMTCNPPLIFSGVSDEFTPKAIGSTIAIILPTADAKAFYPKTDTTALKHVSERMNGIQSNAIEQGAALLNSSGKESGEALRIRQAANTATLISTANAVGKGILKSIRYAGELHGMDDAALDTIEFTPNIEFVATSLTPEMQTSLVNNWNNGMMSKSTVIYNFERGGLLQDGEDVDDEIERINNEAPTEEAAADAVFNSDLDAK